MGSIQKKKKKIEISVAENEQVSYFTPFYL